LTRGLLLGKFMPLHKGHELLIDFALNFADEVTVVVCSTDAEPIPGALRAEWVRRTFPRARVVNLHKDLPQEPPDHPDFWNIWRRELLAVADGQLDYVFTSEPYGDRLAAELGARHVMVDPARTMVPTSGTEIRAEPRANWDFLAEEARPYFVRRIAIVGPESTGKTTLARNLATELETVHVEEYGRLLWERERARATLETMSWIARGHRASEEALARQAKRYLICDTDAMTTRWWSQELFGKVPQDVEGMSREMRYSLHLLLAPDVPWVQDGTRFYGDRRERAFDDLQTMLRERGWPFEEIRGTWPERTEMALRAIGRLDKAR
jgi:HTH-type transcriptional repressor of NAD biosynthesis genes